MQTTLSNIAIPMSRRALGNLAHFLAKAEANAAARKIDPQVFVTARLAPDMFPLSRQVQIACDAAKNGLARLAAIEAPKFEDGEKSFADLHERIRKTLAFIDSVDARLIDGQEDREITFPAGPERKLTMTSHAYLTTWMLPNLFFHVTTAYGILRHNGVDLGKTDYLMGSPA